ncbi:TPA: ABC transporter ATP-binding protein [bacterium]|nr:MAG: ABC transporter ATP-binding protein [Candidatus Hydrogenedentes bacterium CG1_02_42_14]PIU46814.1 MAG: ABC transporter ATP-binding protein [Candidatus Hydrogenedentes bacterium CG07_land_8_20_14_0_80_42_17]HBW46865.1 ABC transporter ATP-binding protein [bacterium]
MSIEIVGVYKSFRQNGKKQVVLSGVDLTIPTSSSVTIIGRSGTGKSVLLKLITRLFFPDAGSIRVDGIEVTTASRGSIYELRENIGFLFQGSALFDSMTVRENVGFALCERSKLALKEINDIVIQRLKAVGLKEDVLDKMPSELSGGMKKRVALARVLATDPKYILYDEPTTGLDPITADAINDLIISTREQFGVTSIVVTHDMTSAFKVSDYVAMLYGGRIIEWGTPEEILKTQNPYVRQFVQGSSKGPISMLE